MNAYILDFKINGIRFLDACPRVPGPLRLFFQSDGLNEIFSSDLFEFGQNLPHDYSCRFVLRLNSLNGSYLRVSLQSQDQSGILALAQVMLTQFPTNEPGTFTLPLKNDADRSSDAVQLSITAIISMLSMPPTVSIQPEHPIHSSNRYQSQPVINHAPLLPTPQVKYNSQQYSIHTPSQFAPNNFQPSPFGSGFQQPQNFRNQNFGNNMQFQPPMYGNIPPPNIFNSIPTPSSMSAAVPPKFRR